MRDVESGLRISHRVSSKNFMERESSYVKIDFGLYPVKESDYSGLKTLTSNFLDSMEFDTTCLCNAIIKNRSVQALVKTSESEAPFGLVTVLNVNRFSQTDFMREIVFILKNRVPEAHTDYIVSVISEEFGSIIIIVLMIIFLFFIYQVFKKLYFEKNNKVKLILVGSISIILFQVLIHIGVNIRLFPTTGMTFPFLSYGGSSILGTAILSGIILNLTKRRINQ
jgi:hypothetical protein